MVEAQWLAAGVSYSRKFHAARDAPTTLTIGGLPCADVICWPYLRGEECLCDGKLAHIFRNGCGRAVNSALSAQAAPCRMMGILQRRLCIQQQGGAATPRPAQPRPRKVRLGRARALVHEASAVVGARQDARAPTETTDPVVAAGRRTSMLGLGAPLKILELGDVLSTQSVPRRVLRERPLHELVIPEEVEV